MQPHQHVAPLERIRMLQILIVCFVCSPFFFSLWYLQCPGTHLAFLANSYGGGWSCLESWHQTLDRHLPASGILQVHCSEAGGQQAAWKCSCVRNRTPTEWGFPSAPAPLTDEVPLKPVCHSQASLLFPWGNTDLAGRIWCGFDSEDTKLLFAGVSRLADWLPAC